MRINLTQYFLRSLIIAPVVGTTGYYGTVLLNYSFELLKTFGMLLVVIVGLWVGFWLFLILKLQKSENKKVKFVGDMMGTGFTYTALFQGILYCVIVFWVLGSLGGAEAFPQEEGRLIFDYLFGSGYIASFVFGASGFTILFTYYKPLNRILGLFCGILGAAIPLYVLIFEKNWLEKASLENPSQMILYSTLFYLLFSFLLMSILSKLEDEKYREKAEAKKKLKAYKNRKKKQ